MAQNAEIFFEHDNWGRALGWSAGFHAAITGLILIYSLVFTGSRGEGWGAGGGGSAIGVTLVSTVPLPATPAQTKNVLANESKGLTKSEPKVEEKEQNRTPSRFRERIPRSSLKSLRLRRKPRRSRHPRRKRTRLPSAKADPSAVPMAPSMPAAPKAASASAAVAEISALDMLTTCTSSSRKFPRIG